MSDIIGSSVRRDYNYRIAFKHRDSKSVILAVDHETEGSVECMMDLKELCQLKRAVNAAIRELVDD